MAKKKEEVVDNGTEGSTAARGKKVMLTRPEDGTQIARADFIKERYAAGATRSEIVKELKEKFGHEVPYQIVFAATKPAKDKKAADTATEAEAA